MSRMCKRIIGISLVVLVGLGIVAPVVAATSAEPSVNVYGSVSVIADSTEIDGGGGDPLPPPEPEPTPPIPTQD